MANAEAMFKRHWANFNEAINRAEENGSGPTAGTESMENVRARYGAMSHIYAACVIAEAMRAGLDET